MMLIEVNRSLWLHLCCLDFGGAHCHPDLNARYTFACYFDGLRIDVQSRPARIAADLLIGQKKHLPLVAVARLHFPTQLQLRYPVS